MEWHVFRLSDGCFTGRRVRTNRIDLYEPPTECAIIGGVTDWRRQRVNLKDWSLEDCEPEPKQRRRHEVRAELQAIDRRKVRPMSELLINPDDAAAKAKLQELNAEAEELRAELSSLTAERSPPEAMRVCGDDQITR